MRYVKKFSISLITNEIDCQSSYVASKSDMSYGFVNYNVCKIFVTSYGLCSDAKSKTNLKDSSNYF